MPKYFAQCAFHIEFRLSVAVRTIEDNQSENNKWDGDCPAGADNDVSVYFEEWLAEEAARQAEKIAERFMFMRGEDPPGISICENGLYGIFVEEEVSDSKALYHRTQDQSFVLTLLVSASSHAEILSLKDGRIDDLYKEADSIASEVARSLMTMIGLNGKLPKGWEVVDDVSVDVDEVTVHGRKTLWEKKLDEYGTDLTYTIPRPVEQINFRCP